MRHARQPGRVHLRLQSRQFRIARRRLTHQQQHGRHPRRHLHGQDTPSSDDRSRVVLTRLHPVRSALGVHRPGASEGLVPDRPHERDLVAEGLVHHLFRHAGVLGDPRDRGPGESFAQKEAARRLDDRGTSPSRRILTSRGVVSPSALDFRGHEAQYTFNYSIYCINYGGRSDDESRHERWRSQRARAT